LSSAFPTTAGRGRGERFLFGGDSMEDWWKTTHKSLWAAVYAHGCSKIERPKNCWMWSVCLLHNDHIITRLRVPAVVVRHNLRTFLSRFQGPWSTIRGIGHYESGQIFNDQQSTFHFSNQTRLPTTSIHFASIRLALDLISKLTEALFPFYKTIQQFCLRILKFKADLKFKAGEGTPMIRSVYEQSAVKTSSGQSTRRLDDQHIC